MKYQEALGSLSAEPGVDVISLLLVTCDERDGVLEQAFNHWAVQLVEGSLWLVEVLTVVALKP